MLFFHAWASSLAIAAVLSFLLDVAAGQNVPLVVTEVAPVRVNATPSGGVFADFGQDAYGTLEIKFSGDPPAEELKVRLGEKLTAQGFIDCRPPGCVNYREVKLACTPGKHVYKLAIPLRKRGGTSIKMPPGIGEVTPFRYAEIEENTALSSQSVEVRQLFVHAPFDDNASAFECSDETLNAVWKLCKHTMKATTAFGIYIDGNRERTPYEADAYINQLSHYACDLDPRIARATFKYLLAHPTWPTEWSLHMPLIATADYMATGDLVLARDYYDALKKKLLREKSREDGLLHASAIVDWPPAERDGYNDGKTDPSAPKQAGPMVNTVANAFYCYAIEQMALLARALHKDQDSRDFEQTAHRVRESFQRVFFDPTRGVYVDGEGSSHASLHANMFALAFGLVPPGQISSVSKYIQSKGMACSVYGAQYLLEALYTTGFDTDALRLMTAKTQRGWYHMIEEGSTMTWEAWTPKIKKNLTWNHAWGSVPANIISRFVLGVRPVSPGYKKLLIEPRPGDLLWAWGKVPTAIGPVCLTVGNGSVFHIDLQLPETALTTVRVPVRSMRQVFLDGKSVQTIPGTSTAAVEIKNGGWHSVESR